MPFQSKAQQRYLFATHPDVAKRFAAETPASAYARLPQHKGGSVATPDYAALAKERARRNAKKTVIPAKKGQKPISFTPGGLHASLGVPQGQPIPNKKFGAALAGNAGTKARKQALFAKNVLHRG